MTRLGNHLFYYAAVENCSDHTHKVSDGPEASVLVLLQEPDQQRAHGLRLPLRQRQRLVEDPVVHLIDVTAVERRLKQRDERRSH